MAFVRHRGKTKFMYFEGDTAKEVRDGGLVSISDSGTVIRLDNDSTDKTIGVARRNDTIAHDTTLKVPVEVPVELGVEWLIDVDSVGGAADSDIGAIIQVDTLGGGSVNAGDSNGMRVSMQDTFSPSVLVTGVISGTQITGVLVNTVWTQVNDSNDST